MLRRRVAGIALVVATMVLVSLAFGFAASFYASVGADPTVSLSAVARQAAFGVPAKTFTKPVRHSLLL